ncbi:MAG: YceI [Proteobacteria bacterium]|nr:YceI [Pseudomonadota bacterium]
MNPVLLALTLAAVLPWCAHAAEYRQIQADQSAITFAYQQMGVAMWFNTSAFPAARFVTSSVKALGDHRYEATGQLTIKGKTQDVVVPATFTAQGKTGIFDGRFTLRRGDFAIGEGPWAAFDVVANEVQIQFRITAQAGE